MQLTQQEREKPYLEKSGTLPSERAKFLMTDDNMKGKYLGACLENSRWGSQTTVMYEMDIKGLIGFIQHWMQQNPENFTMLWQKKEREEMNQALELPYTQHETCPTNESHKRVVTDLAGRVRCAYKSEQKGLTSACHAIISDKGRILPLETIIKRLNLRPETETIYCSYKSFPDEACNRRDDLSPQEKETYDLTGHCQGHIQPHDKVEFPFDGWDLAAYAQKWYQQSPNGKSPLFET